MSHKTEEIYDCIVVGNLKPIFIIVTASPGRYKLVNACGGKVPLYEAAAGGCDILWI